jgi:crotonobetainyl-CoA:carnitine CoA-transferase CaiB-like acyl-CoA transferase
MVCGMSAPLSGILVVALEQAVAIPFATRQLAVLGAHIVKIERPNGGGTNELQRLIIAKQLLQKYAL